MKNRSMKWGRFFETLIYTILLALPLISVFARVIYTQSNNHSYLSYSDTKTMAFTKIDNNNTSLFAVGRNYYFFGIDTTYNYQHGTAGGYNYFTWSDISIDFADLYDLSYEPDGISFSSGSSSITMSFHNPLSDTWIFYIQQGKTSVFWSTLPTFEFTLMTYDVPTYQFADISYLASYLGKLDNAFDYGLQKTIDDFGIGNINFLNWFGTMFSNNTNLLYINFVNMYLNYALWVSVGYLIYYFLTFFVKIIRNLVDSFIKKGESW